MQEKNKARIRVKSKLHPRNIHQGRYDLKDLASANPDLNQHVQINAHGDLSIDFFDSKAVVSLNKALILRFYGISSWDLPEGYLCPSVPGRADYMHHMADVLASEFGGEVPRGPKIRCMDIGVGASCIYPIVGRSAYDWTFICSDIDRSALDSAKSIVAANPILKDRVHCRLQTKPEDILHGVLQKNEFVDLVICNPPFHASASEAEAASLRKLKNLRGMQVDKPVLNFGGRSNELWTRGGEKRFVLDLVRESRQFARSCLFFSTLISKEKNLRPLLRTLSKEKVQASNVIPMGQGNKVSRIVTWTFLNADERARWVQPKK